MPRFLRPPLNVRIWEFVERADRCVHWLWHGNFDIHGQPVVVLNKADWETFNIKKRFGTKARKTPSTKLTAVRAMWGLLRGNVPLDKLVIRTCAEGACVNPYHCRLGLNKQVYEEVFKNGRKPSASASVKAVLNEEQVLQIVERYAEGDISQQLLGEEYGVSQLCVSQIVTGETWASVTGIQRDSVRSRWRRDKSREINPPKYRFRD